jgi:hypothetical protein
MGAWSEDNFGNDDALDWVCDLEKSKGLEALLAPIHRILNETDYLEAPDCCEALAASEVIAAAVSNDASNIPEQAQRWLNRKQGLFGKKPQIDLAHAQLASKAVDKIVSGSELQELWDEDETNEEWHLVQKVLITRLGSK